ncbi:hypothetical protein D3C72_1259010 [compost metagenome]
MGGEGMRHLVQPLAQRCILVGLLQQCPHSGTQALRIPLRFQRVGQALQHRLQVAIVVLIEQVGPQLLLRVCRDIAPEPLPLRPGGCVLEDIDAAGSQAPGRLGLQIVVVEEPAALGQAGGDVPHIRTAQDVCQVRNMVDAVG